MNCPTKNTVISVAFNVSNAYAQHLCVVMTSILENNASDHFDFIVLNNDISENNRAILSSLSKSYKNFSLRFVSVDELRFRDVCMSSSYISTVAYFRLLLAELLPELDKVLYLDVDLVVNGDIGPLFNTDISDFYFAGVEERCLYGTGYLEKVLKFSSDELYINAGVLLCNLKKIRQDGLVSVFLDTAETLSEEIKYDDQDVLNLVARGKIKRIDSIYNFTPYHLYELNKKKYSAVIVHFAGKNKPWTLAECPNELAFMYFKYLEKTPYRDTLKVKNFCIYHQDGYIFETDAIIPIQTGTYHTKRGLDILQASEGDSIDHKNKNFGELTAWYWVWKNYLNKHPKVEYVGFCHYRRILDYQADSIWEKPIKFTTLDQLLDRCNDSYSSAQIYERIKNFDVVLPPKWTMSDESIEEQYLKHHPKRDLEVLKNIVRENYPEYTPYLDKVLGGNSAYFNLVFTMRSDLLDDFFSWAFDILSKLESVSDWSQYHSYDTVRTPAYLIERFFNVWLEFNRDKKQIRVLEKQCLAILFYEEGGKYVPYDFGRLKFTFTHKLLCKARKMFYKVAAHLCGGRLAKYCKEREKKEAVYISAVRRKEVVKSLGLKR